MYSSAYIIILRAAVLTSAIPPQQIGNRDSDIFCTSGGDSWKMCSEDGKGTQSVVDENRIFTTHSERRYCRGPEYLCLFV